MTFPTETRFQEDLFASDCHMVPERLSDWRPWLDLHRAVEGGPPLLLVGEGSSRIFPLGFARHIERHFGLPPRLQGCGGRAAPPVAGAAYTILGCSNSGATREVLEYLDSLQTTTPPMALLGVARDAPLIRWVGRYRAVLPRPERAVAATASVFLHALELGAATAARARQVPPIERLRRGVQTVLGAPSSSTLTVPAGHVRRIWWAGDESGLSGELALKTAELAGLLGIDASGNLSLHGTEEVLDGDDLVIWLDHDERDDALRDRIARDTGARQIYFSDASEMADLGPWRPLALLTAGWRFLAALARERGRDPARPRRARKIGNAAPGHQPNTSTTALNST